MTMALPTIDDLVAVYSHAKDSEIGQASNALHQHFGHETLIPLLAEVYPRLRRSSGRTFVLFELSRYARVRQDVVTLARMALADRAYLVPAEACSILAYSLRDDVIPALDSLLTHTHQATRADAAAAIDAIRAKNHHFYVDRKHTGNVFWQVNPGDVSG